MKNKLDKKTAIQLEQLNHLYSVNFLPLFTSVTLAAILAFVQRDVVNLSVIVVWLSLIILIMVARTILIFTYQQSSTDIKAETRCWLLWFRLGILITGAVWGAAGVLLFPANYPQNQMFLIFMLVGLTAGAVTSYASDLVSALSFSALVLTPCIIRLMLVGGSVYWAMSLASILYLGFLMMSLRYINRNISENILLRLEATEREVTLKRKAQELSTEIIYRSQVETDLLKAKEIAEESTRIKSEFLANMSHEIRTPMNGVLGMLDLLSETSLSPLQVDWVKTALSSGQVLLDIINDILDFSKLEADKLIVEQVDFNLIDLVEDVRILSSIRALPKGLALNCRLPTSMPARWRGDPMRIQQVLTNLMSNAVKFTEQGEVTLNIIQSVTANNADELRFEIHDTGIGISESTLSSLFEPFVQADGATSRRFGGSGLGLSISKKLVELMGGIMGADSIYGKGSCFWFSLPLIKSDSDLSDKRVLIVEAKAPLPNYQHKKVLIVEDNKINQKVLVAKLRKYHIVPDVVENGLLALDKLAQCHYDLIFMDCHMPIMDGYTATRELRLLESQKNLVRQTVIALTANALEGERDKCLAVGMDDYITKPIVTSLLMTLLIDKLGGTAPVT